MTTGAVTRKTLIYGIIAAALLVIFLLQETLHPARNTIPFPKVDSSIDRIGISTQEGSLSLQKAGENWTVGDRQYPGDNEKITSVLDTISGITKGVVVATRENYADYGLDDTALREVTLSSGSDDVLTLQVGSTSASGNALYGRINGSREVILLPGSLNGNLSSDPKVFREKEMAKIPEDHIVLVRIKSKDFNTVTVQRANPDSKEETAAGSEWVSDTDEKIEPDAYTSLFKELALFKADDFLEDSGTFGTPFANLTIELQNRTTTEISIGPPRQGGQYPVEVSGNPYRFTVPEWRARRLLLGMDRYFEAFAKDETS